MSIWLSAREFEDAMSDTGHTLAEVETVKRGDREEIAFIDLSLSNGRRLRISSVSGADLAIEETT